MASNESLVMGAFVGDAICLGPHWIYDAGRIEREIEDPARFHDPISAYHPGKRAGDFTHYGDQLLVFLKHLGEAHRFDLEAYAAAWRTFWLAPETISYRDGATRQTLANLEKGLPLEEAGADSHDIAGISIIAPLFLLDWDDDEALLIACRDLTGLTHRDHRVMEGAEFFGRVLLSTGRGRSITHAMEDAGAELSDHSLKQWFEAGRKSAAGDATDGAALEEHGLSCDIDGGFAGVCHLLFRHPDDAVLAMVENAKAGGDNAARGILLGMVYGAAKSIDGFPEDWFSGLSAHGEILRCFGELRE